MLTSTSAYLAGCVSRSDAGRDGFSFMAGATTEKFLPAYDLENIVNGGFLEYYDSGQYDAAVKYCVDSVYKAYVLYYGLDGSQQQSSDSRPGLVSRGAVLLILAVWFLFRICTPNRRRAGGFWNVFIPLSMFNSFSRHAGRYGGGFGSGRHGGGGFSSGGGSAWRGGGFGSGGRSSGSHFGGGGHSRGGGVGR